MTKKKDLNPDIMSEISEEEIQMSGIYEPIITIIVAGIVDMKPK